jgi:hypothetical protein
MKPKLFRHSSETVSALLRFTIWNPMKVSLLMALAFVLNGCDSGEHGVASVPYQRTV